MILGITEEDEIVESDSAVTKAGGVVSSIANPEQHMTLILRYKSTYARVLDANRKFLQAASRYHDLSQSSGELIRAEDLLGMLGRAATCAILAPSGPQRQRVLGHVGSLLYHSPCYFGCELADYIIFSLAYRFTKMKGCLNWTQLLNLKPNRSF